MATTTLVQVASDVGEADHSKLKKSKIEKGKRKEAGGGGALTVATTTPIGSWERRQDSGASTMATTTLVHVASDIGEADRSKLKKRKIEKGKRKEAGGGGVSIVATTTPIGVTK
ncbi:hypothetical protein CRG98_040399 [Punica granatum]|uniref:Uncharacterized protein n=1 Tax=Punica granatum TaxID=22663 RepID=A0A2I0I6B3_PUNGR|nr:hypothetical protein CRG98_040399 [Punica granatum]